MIHKILDDDEWLINLQERYDGLEPHKVSKIMESNICEDEHEDDISKADVKIS